ncbi:toxic anion resistance protein [Eubacterium sp. An11]|uniref:toxic anion resistance protein n=1 Tax=Eubacterium sp. An11 TaxID=1965542 RepID=UPI000B383501|nr:toxic anion resistance protein [Eubacterium sp. An11]OUQ63585.1 toxic anion resistance protein [Eubacterium sp. An11]
MDIEQLLKEGPSLTLNPEEEFSDLAVEEPKKEEVQAEEAYEEEKYLTDAEKKQVDAFVKEIELKDSAAILQYGSGIQKKMSDFSEGTLNKVRNKDLGEIGELLSGVVTELKAFDEEESKGVFGFFKKKMAKAEALKLKYDKAEASIEKVSKTLEGHQMQLLKDSALLDQLYDLNKVYFRELNMYILAGKKKLRQVMEEELPQARARATASGMPEDAQEVSDIEAMCNRFEKKIHDLELTRMVSLQMAPQIRMIQSSDAMMAEKIQSTLVNTIPLWKSQMIIALGVEHSRQASEAQREVSDFTNSLLKKNAEKLKTATVETARESERGIVDMETLIATNENLISTIDEVMRIQSEGREKRREAEVRLTELEDQLKNKLLETSYR